MPYMLISMYNMLHGLHSIQLNTSTIPMGILGKVTQITRCYTVLLDIEQLVIYRHVE